jgi:hypothetical protein
MLRALPASNRLGVLQRHVDTFRALVKRTRKHGEPHPMGSGIVLAYSFNKAIHTEWTTRQKIEEFH